MEREDLEKIAEVVLRHDLIVITDEIYSELIRELTSALQICPACRSDYTHKRVFKGLCHDRVAFLLRAGSCSHHGILAEDTPVRHNVQLLLSASTLPYLH